MVRGMIALRERKSDAREALTDEGRMPAPADRKPPPKLVLEDVQRLTERAADAACDLIDRRAARRKALVVTAGAGPAALTHLPRRLTSRLAAGLVVQLEPLGVASRRTILDAAAKMRNVRIAPDALDWLAGRGGGPCTAAGVLPRPAPRWPP